jgi:hypothetical protein
MLGQDALVYNYINNYNITLVLIDNNNVIYHRRVLDLAKCGYGRWLIFSSDSSNRVW